MKIFLVCAALLSLERIFYIWLCRAPAIFRGWSGRPIALLFCAFKAVQAGAFGWWCWTFGGGEIWPPPGGVVTLTFGASLVTAGQILNLGVFHRLGTSGVLYASQLGEQVNWTGDFPFSVFRHPQYVGVVLTIWGVFTAFRCPQPDWWMLPTLETAYYALGARLET